MENEAIWIRASSLWELLDCPLRWYVKQVERRVLPASAPAAIGTAVHRSTAVYDSARLAGDQAAAREAVAAAVDWLREPEEEVDWTDMPRAKAERMAIDCHQRYVGSFGQRAYTHVELPLKPLVVAVEGAQIQLTGTLDRIRTDHAGRLGVCDVKTGRAAVSVEGRAKAGAHKPQVAVYEVLAERTLGQPMGLAPEILGLQTGGTARVGATEVPGARAALVGTGDQPGFLEHAALYLRTGLFPPNPGSLLCKKRYCPHYEQCPYHG